MSAIRITHVLLQRAGERDKLLTFEEYLEASTGDVAETKARLLDQAEAAVAKARIVAGAVEAS